VGDQHLVVLTAGLALLGRPPVAPRLVLRILVLRILVLRIVALALGQQHAGHGDGTQARHGGHPNSLTSH
jgi:hypothetical protein